MTVREWIVIAECWPWLARAIAARAALMRELEDAPAAGKPRVSDPSVGSVVERRGLKVLARRRHA